MFKGSIYHRPESEYAYLYTKDAAHLRIRTEKGDMKRVSLIAGDPYMFNSEHWSWKETDLKLLCSTDIHDYWTVEVTPEFRRLQYGFHLVDKKGEEVFYGDKGVFPFEKSFLETPNLYFKLPYFHDIDRFKAPKWVTNTVWYQIFPERFNNGDVENDPEGVLPWNSKKFAWNDFFGGDLQGVIDKLDYLKELGINGIYLCPIFEAPSNHKYDTIDYYQIDKNFGDKNIFRTFMDLAHKKGFKVMLDAVFNHMGDVSPQWQDIIIRGEKSKFADWFHINEFPVSYKETDNFNLATDITYDTFAFTPHMPKLNTTNPEVQDYLLGIAKYWIEEFDIDAWRLDVANEIDHKFWKMFHDEVCSLKDDFYILGEVWNSAQPWLQGDEFHGSMNYAYTELIEQYFAKNQISASKLVESLNEQLMMYRKQTNQVMMNMLDSHDTARILYLCNGDEELVKKAFAFMFLQPGSPCIYYGTEIAMTGGPDPDCRRCMDWDAVTPDNNMLNFMRKLIHYRRDNDLLLSSGDISFKILEKDIILVSRNLKDKTISAIFNQSNKTIVLKSVNVDKKTVLSNLQNNETELKEGNWAIFDTEINTSSLEILQAVKG